MTSASCGRSLASPGQPREAAGPVFDHPWEAQLFSMTVLLHQRGIFTWPEWTDALGAEIASAASRGAAADAYYGHWLAALESLLARRGILESAISLPSQPGT